LGRKSNYKKIGRGFGKFPEKFVGYKGYLGIFMKQN